MPIYDYVCANCRHRTEVIHGINDPGPKFCPNCGAEGTLRKALSTPAIHFKGSGWAKKDRSSSSTSSRSRSGSSAPGDGGASSGGDGSTSGGDSKDSSSTKEDSSASKSSASDSGSSSSSSKSSSED